MPIKLFRLLPALLAPLLFLAACSHARTAFSPLVGSWKINGSPPAANANLPQFTALQFKSNGAVDASYIVADGALGRLVQASPQTRQERDTYTVADPAIVHIMEGSRSLDYTYEVHDNRLLLTPRNGNSTLVYVRVPNS